MTRPRYEYRYDAFDNQTRVIDPLLRETAFSYDANGNLLTHTLPIGVSTTGDPDDFVAQKFYDAQGRLDYEITFEGVYVRYGYGSFDRLTTKEYFGDSASWNNGLGTPQRTTQYTYDEFGRVGKKREEKVSGTE